MSEKQPFDRPTVYQIRIKGHIDPQWSDWFGGLSITREAEGECVLSGVVTDQGALYGLLKKIHDLNLPLISVTRIDCDMEQIVKQPEKKGGAEATIEPDPDAIV